MPIAKHYGALRREEMRKSAACQPYRDLQSRMYNRFVEVIRSELEDMHAKDWLRGGDVPSDLSILHSRYGLVFKHPDQVTKYTPYDQDPDINPWNTVCLKRRGWSEPDCVTESRNRLEMIEQSLEYIGCANTRLHAYYDASWRFDGLPNEEGPLHLLLAVPHSIKPNFQTGELPDRSAVRIPKTVQLLT